MLWRLIAKLTFKACVPLILLAGVLTYGVYLRGGDPGALWKGIAGRASDQAVSLFSNMGDDASRAASALGRGAAAATGTGSRSGAGTQNGLTRVYTWKDASGVTHYSSAEPEGVRATSVSVDPNVNVLAPVKAPRVEVTDTHEAAEGESAERLPGVAGHVLSTRSDRQADGNGAGDSSSGAALDPAQLLRMLQSTQE